MAFILRLGLKAEKQLASIPSPYKERITLALTSIAANPWMGKKLKGEYEGSYSVRTWPYRIIYKIYKRELLISVIKIKHRGRAYH